MMCTHLAEVIPLRGCQVVEAETTAGMHQKLVESLRRYCVWPGISPVSSNVDSRGQGQGGGDDRTPHGMAGNRWLARCRPAVTLKAYEGKTSKKKKKVSKTSDDRQYSREWQRCVIQLLDLLVCG